MPAPVKHLGKELKPRHTRYTREVALRLQRSGKIECPAGELVSRFGIGCRCRIEHSTITAAENPSSLDRFCMGDFKQCPTWRAERDKREVAPLVEKTDKH